MRFNRSILSITLLVVALAWTLWFVFAGFGNHQDPLYWLYKYQHLEGGWMAIGTLLTGGAVVQICGAELLPLRLFGWLCTVAAIAIPYCCLLNKEQRKNNLHWLALALLLMGYGAFQEFSPGTLTVLLLSAIWVTAGKSSIIHTATADRKNHQSSIFTAILAGIAVSVRFPNILVLLVLIPLWKKRSQLCVPIVVATAGIVYLLGYLFVTPAPMDAAMTSHDLWPMITKLWTNAGMLIGFILMGIGVLALGEKFKLRITNYKLQIAGIVTGTALVLFIAYTIKPTQWYNIDLTYLISALCIVIALAASKSPITNDKLPIGIAILAIATLGTDTAWLKLFPAVLCLLPVAAAQYAKPMRTYLWWVMVPVTLMVMVRHSTNSIGKNNLTEATTISAISPYRGIAITEAQEARIRQYKTDFNELVNEGVSELENRKVLALGQENHLMRAVTGCEAARYNEFWSNIFDSVYTAKYRPIIEAEQPMVFCSFSPQFKTKPEYKDRQSAMENMLRELGYQEIERSTYKYTVFIPNEGVSE